MSTQSHGRNELGELPSRLLSLPPELRNRIWEYALQPGVPITITKALKLPALLSTSRQIRQECQGIYSRGNEFHITVYDMDHGLIRAWYELTRSRGLKHGTLKVSFRGKRRWANFKLWLDAVYLGQLDPLQQNPADGAVYKNKDMVKAQAVAQTLRGEPKHVYETTIEHVRGLLGLINREWLED